jgi:hypothetical protein
MDALQQHMQQKQQTATQMQLQRQHIEITIVAASGCRLCAALARSQAPGESWEAPQHSPKQRNTGQQPLSDTAFLPLGCRLLAGHCSCHSCVCGWAVLRMLG